MISTPIQISLCNFSTVFPDSQLPILANALSLQANRDFFGEWGIGCKLYYTPTGKNPTAGHWVLGLFDDSTQAGALGFHDIDGQGNPLGKVFVKTTLADGQKVEVTASHELLEILADPDVNLSGQDGTKFWAYEVCDAVENIEYAVTIPAGWVGAGTSVAVSNFVLPSYWEGFRTTGPFDFLQKLTAPLTLTPGGYMSYLDLNSPSQGWIQVTARGLSADAKVKARPYPGSRRERRTIPRDQWVKSTYQPGDTAVPAEAA